MTEVVVIVFLVGIGCIGVAGLYGDNIRGLFGGSAESLAGDTNVANPGKEAKNTSWTLRGGSLSAYGANNSFNPGGSSDAPRGTPPPPGGGDNGGFNPGGAGDPGSKIPH